MAREESHELVIVFEVVMQCRDGKVIVPRHLDKLNTIQGQQLLFLFEHITEKIFVLHVGWRDIELKRLLEVLHKAKLIKIN